MIKAVFFDVDGTLVSHKSKSIPKSAKESIEKLRKNGIKVFLSTGRHVHELKGMPTEEIEFDGYIILNGQIGLDEKKNIIFSHPFAKEEVKGLVEIFEKREYPMVLVNAQGHYMNLVNDYVEMALGTVSTPVPPIREYQGENLFQATIFIPSSDDRMWEEKLPFGCKLARWGEYGTDIIAKEGGKAIGMKFFGQLLGILPEEMMAFGDAQNDMDMIAYAGTGIAMGNAKQCLKEIADDITAEVDQDGVAKALEKYGML